MPFSATTSTTKEEWTKIYTDLFRPIIEDSKFGYVCKRSEIENGAFTKDIVQNLKNVHLVLADLTDFNPNVMWELGVRHSLSKRTIMVARSDFIEKIPSDIRAYGVIPYIKDITEFKEFEKKIQEVLQKIETNPEKSDNPVFDFLKEEEIILSLFEKRLIIGKLTGLLSELLFNLNFINLTKKAQNKIQRFQNKTFKFSTYALNDLASTNYVTLKEDEMSWIRVTISQATYINRILEVFSTEKLNAEAVDQIDAVFIDFEENTKKCIAVVNLTLTAIKKSSHVYSEPPVTIIDQEFKKLLE